MYRKDAVCAKKNWFKMKFCRLKVRHGPSYFYNIIRLKIKSTKSETKFTKSTKLETKSGRISKPLKLPLK